MRSPRNPSAPGVLRTASPGVLRTSARRFELYVRVSLYFILALEVLPALLLLVVSNGGPISLIPVALGMVLQTVANILVCRWALTAMRPGRLRTGKAGRRLLLAWAAVCVAVWVITAAFLVDPVSHYFVALVVLAPLAAIAPVFDRRLIVIGSALAVVLLFVINALTLVGSQGWGYVVGLVLGLVVSVVAVVFSFWVSGWMLRVVWALEDARAEAAGLAIAEERLRIARDLHDVFGRTLATVAVKSELAAELIRRGRADDAAGEIAAVRTIADEAGQEVRQVVRGVRTTDLGTELDGARALLDSAGITSRVEGEPPADLAPEVAAALGWALREAVTNVIRHSRASSCTITLTGPDPVRLLVSNDGALAPGGENRGHGLAGMAERVKPYGGEVIHRDDAGRFVLDVTVPVVNPAVAAR